MEQEEHVALTLRLPKRVHEELSEIARAERRSLNAALIIAAERYIREARRQLGDQEEPRRGR